MDDLTVVEICAGAGGQALGLELAGFEHALAVELDEGAAATLRLNRPHWMVRVGDVADPQVWKPAAYGGVDLMAGGVPCPPFSMAGKQLGAGDERDLFAWAVEQAVSTVRPRALLLENVRGLSSPRFAAYRQHVHDRLLKAGYWSEWRLLQASNYGVPQLRPRFVLVALREHDAPYFTWPEPTLTTETVGTALRDLMSANDWPGVNAWARGANRIAPTIVGGSKKHGGADLGPTRAKKAWADLGVDGLGIADDAPGADHPLAYRPRLTNQMVARLQGWLPNPEYQWLFHGRKTSTYRQIGNAFPPPVARALGLSIRRALSHDSDRHEMEAPTAVVHDPIYRALRELGRFASRDEVMQLVDLPLTYDAFERHIANLSQDFDIERASGRHGALFRLGEFKGFVGQSDHARHGRFLEMRSTIS